MKLIIFSPRDPLWNLVPDQGKRQLYSYDHVFRDLQTWASWRGDDIVRDIEPEADREIWRRAFQHFDGVHKRGKPTFLDYARQDARARAWVEKTGGQYSIETISVFENKRPRKHEVCVFELEIMHLTGDEEVLWKLGQ